MKKILIVEDDELSYFLFKEFFKKAQVELIWTKYGDQAVEICKNQPDIDLVLMDIKLPDSDGYLTTQKIKKLRQNLPVIAQTAYALTGEKEKSREAGCDDYISKPIDNFALRQKLNKHLYGYWQLAN